AYDFVDTNEKAKDDEESQNNFVGGKRYKVRLHDSFDIEQSLEYGEGEFIFETTDLPYAESIGTTQDIDNAELISLVPEMWDQGYWDANGYKVSSDTSIRLSNNIKARPNTEYTLKSYGDYELMARIFDDDGDHVRLIKSGLNDESSFLMGEGTSHLLIYISTTNGSQEDITPSMVGKELKVSMKKTHGGINSKDELWGFGMGLISDDKSLTYTHTGTSFEIFNAGNVLVHPFEQELKMEISECETKKLSIKNLNTGDEKEIKNLKLSDVTEVKGANVTKNELQYLRETNKQFISVAPGWNEFYLSDTAKASFDFRFYYL